MLIAVFLPGLGTVTTVQVALPQDFGSWDRLGSDGKTMGRLYVVSWR